MQIRWLLGGVKSLLSAPLFKNVLLYYYFFLILEAIAQRGDVIGCAVTWGDKAYVDKRVTIVFTLNGKQITQDEIVMEYDPFKKIYPYICMGHTGMTVLAKVSTFLTAHAFLQSIFLLRKGKIYPLLIGCGDRINSELKQPIATVERTEQNNRFNEGKQCLCTCALHFATFLSNDQII